MNDRFAETIQNVIEAAMLEVAARSISVETSNRLVESIGDVTYRARLFVQTWHVAKVLEDVMYERKRSRIRRKVTR